MVTLTVDNSGKKPVIRLGAVVDDILSQDEAFALAKQLAHFAFNGKTAEGLLDDKNLLWKDR